MSHMRAFVLICISCFWQPNVSAQTASPTALIGIDHIPLAVHSIDAASEHYAGFGFALKPAGRMQTASATLM